MNYIFFDTQYDRVNLYPFSLTRPLSTLRIGINTIEEKWKQYISGYFSYLVPTYLQVKFPIKLKNSNIFINSTVLPSTALIKTIQQLPLHKKLFQGDVLIAYKGDEVSFNKILQNKFNICSDNSIQFNDEIVKIKNKWDIFLVSPKEINQDLKYIKKKRLSHFISDKYTICYAIEHIFFEANVTIHAAILNAEEGPIYIGKNAIIHEGAIIRGPVSIGEGAQINAGARIQNSVIGPYTKIGGEVTDTVFLGYSNKAHDGFIGNSVIGEWCNLGAGTNTSNLKNTYRKIKTWNDTKKEYQETGLQFCGIFMGDYNQCSINTIFNAGTILGIHISIGHPQLIKKFIPSFTWINQDNTIYHLDKAYTVAQRMMYRRSKNLTVIDRGIFAHIYHMIVNKKIYII